ncbi:MAG: hypothetical protein ACRC62_05615 [Microcoleus sp.]
MLDLRLKIVTLRIADREIVRTRDCEIVRLLSVDRRLMAITPLPPEKFVFRSTAFDTRIRSVTDWEKYIILYQEESNRSNEISIGRSANHNSAISPPQPRTPPTAG